MNKGILLKRDVRVGLQAKALSRFAIRRRRPPQVVPGGETRHKTLFPHLFKPPPLSPFHPFSQVIFIVFIYTVMAFVEPRVDLLIPPGLRELWEEKGHDYGVMGSGALFGAGWWFWLDAVCQNPTPPLHHLPGVAATLAVVMINALDPDSDSSYQDESAECQSRAWLLLSYLISFGAVVGAVLVLVTAAKDMNEGDPIWTGVAAVLQCVLLLASGIFLFVTRAAAGLDSSGFAL